jgi:Arc/MetJ-type ribon-helix-helix transcriptional regulator
VLTGIAKILALIPCEGQSDIHVPSIQMVEDEMAKIHELRASPADTEKITINMGYVDLGHIDLMVREGFYSNRTDFIRTAIRSQLDRHGDVLRKSVERQQLDLGLRRYSRGDLESVRAAKETLHIQVLGLAIIEADVSPELARETIASIHVLGALQAPAAVKAALKDRIH